MDLLLLRLCQTKTFRHNHSVEGRHGNKEMCINVYKSCIRENYIGLNQIGKEMCFKRMGSHSVKLICIDSFYSYYLAF